MANNILIPQMEPWFDDLEINAVTDYMKSGGWVMEFKKTEEFEKMLTEYTGAKHCIAITNGTISLTLAMIALGLTTGDEILIPNLTMIASPNSAAMVGIKPILVDIEEKTLCMDLEKAAKAITSKTKALMYVSLNGRSVNMEKVVKFCQQHNLFLIEDAAQALGSFWSKKHLGTFGDFGSLSFSAPKVISTGQGGALLTNDTALYRKIKQLKDFGRERGGVDIHTEMGWNFKFTDIQAVIGIEQMKKLDWRVERKKEIYKRYEDNLKDVNEIEFIKTDLSLTSPWFVDIYVPNPQSLSLYLKEVGVGTRLIYPAVSTQKIYSNEFADQEFPVSLRFASRGLWLPSSSKLTDKQIDLICELITDYYRSVRKATKLVNNFQNVFAKS